MKSIKFWVGVLLTAILFTVPLSAQLTGPTTSGVVSLDGSNPTSVQTGLRTLTSCVVTANTATVGQLGVILSVFTVQFTPTSGLLSIYAWMPTSSSNTTLVASTSGAQVAWLCTGTTN